MHEIHIPNLVHWHIFPEFGSILWNPKFHSCKPVRNPEKKLNANMVFISCVYVHNLFSRSYIFCLAGDSFIRNGLEPNLWTI